MYEGMGFGCVRARGLAVLGDGVWLCEGNKGFREDCEICFGE